jgi:ribosomal protein S18 acetylase RimI-like enzyme
MNPVFRSHFFDDPRARASFEVCAQRVFGLDFSRWKDKGLWDAAYTPFAAFVDGACVASLCVYPSLMRVGGRDRRGAQLLTVGTLPEFRRRGLQRALWTRASQWIRQTCDFTFLFTHAAAAGFYRQLGLQPRPEFASSIQLADRRASSSSALRRLDLDEPRDYELLAALAGEREFVSDQLGWKNANLLLFRCLYAYRDWCYLAPELEAVLVAEITADALRLHDVIARRMPSWAELAPWLRSLGPDQVEVLFCADRLGLVGAALREVTEELLFVDDRFDLAPPLVFPYSIRA